MIPTFVFAAHADPNAVLKQVIAKHIGQTSAAVFVREGNSKALPIKVSFSPKGGRAWLPNQTIVESNSTRMRFYDDIFGQVASSEARTVAHPERDLISASVVHRGAMAFLIDDAIKKEFLADIAKLSGWKLSGRTLKTTDKRKGTTAIQFDTQNRITRVTVTVNKKNILDNMFEYVTDVKVPQIPTTAKVRAALQARPQIPISTGPGALNTTFAVWRSMSRLGTTTISQKTDSASYQTSVAPGRISESGGARPWSYADRKLTFDGTSKTVSTAMALDNLKSKGIYVSPLTRYLMNGQIPFLDIFDRSNKIVDGSSIAVDGKMARILKIERTGNRLRVYADAKTNRIVLVANETKDSRGNWVTTSRLKLSYR
jgi:hypothetical protein